MGATETATLDKCGGGGRSHSSTSMVCLVSEGVNQRNYLALRESCGQTHDNVEFFRLFLGIVYKISLLQFGKAPQKDKKASQ